MTHWISLDWDFITGDCRHKIQHCCMAENCSCGVGKMGRGIPSAGFGNAEWNLRLKLVTDKLKLLSISDALVHDNHGEIYKYLQRGDTVYNFDYHTDDYDTSINGKFDPVACWNWVNYAERDSVTVYQFCDTNDILLLDTAIPYKLFVAWSTPYTRSDLDGHLLRLLMNLGTEVRLNAR